MCVPHAEGAGRVSDIKARMEDERWVFFFLAFFWGGGGGDGDTRFQDLLGQIN